MEDLPGDIQECFLLRLPHELLESILSSNVLTHHDLVNFGQTCHCLRDFIAENNNLWKEFFRRRWPRLFDEINQKKVFVWLQEFKERTAVSHLCRKELMHISRKHYKETEVTRITLYDFLSELKDDKDTFTYVIDELYAIATSGDTDCHLTKRHYAREMLKVIWNVHLMKEWQNLSVLPVKEQVLEKGAILVSQGFQVLTVYTYERLKKNLDSIANMVKTELMKTHKDHPLFQADLSHLQEENLVECLWSPQNCRDILKTINVVLYEQLGFQGNTTDYYNLDNSLIDRVLETRKGIPITLGILYEAVARRLGVRLEGVGHPSHFMFRWMEYPEKPGKQKYTYIDAFNGGKQFPAGVCPRAQANNNPLLAAPPMEVLQRMVRNIIHSPALQDAQNGMINYSAETFHLATRFWSNPSTLVSQAVQVQSLCQTLISKNLHLHATIDVLQRLKLQPHDRLGKTEDLLEEAKFKLLEEAERFRTNEVVISPRRREPGVCFAVGMVMYHHRFDYTCVIYSWDNVCMAGDAWIQAMGVMQLRRQKHQPFYNVLVQDGTIRYAAEENLCPSTNPCRINHPLIGRYFNKYCGKYYEPNEELSAEYPEDRALILEREM